MCSKEYSIISLSDASVHLRFLHFTPVCSFPHPRYNSTDPRLPLLATVSSDPVLTAAIDFFCAPSPWKSCFLKSRLDASLVLKEESASYTSSLTRCTSSKRYVSVNCAVKFGF